MSDSASSKRLRASKEKESGEDGGGGNDQQPHDGSDNDGAPSENGQGSEAEEPMEHDQGSNGAIEENDDYAWLDTFAGSKAAILAASKDFETVVAHQDQGPVIFENDLHALALRISGACLFDSNFTVEGPTDNMQVSTIFWFSLRWSPLCHDSPCAVPPGAVPPCFLPRCSPLCYAPPCAVSPCNISPCSLFCSYSLSWLPLCCFPLPPQLSFLVSPCVVCPDAVPPRFCPRCFPLCHVSPRPCDVPPCFHLCCFPLYWGPLCGTPLPLHWSSSVSPGVLETASLVNPLNMLPLQVIKIVTATPDQTFMIAVVAGHNPILAKLPNARRIHPKIEIWHGHDDKEGDFLAPHEQPITGAFTSKFLSYLVNYDEALNDLRRRPTTDRPAAVPYSPPFSLDAFNEVFAVMQVYEQGMKLPIYKELLANLRLNPVSIIECQNAKNVNDGFFITRFANYALRTASTPSQCLTVTAKTCLPESASEMFPIEVCESKCPCYTAFNKKRMSGSARRSASVKTSKPSCCCHAGLIRMCLSKYNCQSALDDLLLLKRSGHDMPGETHMLNCVAEKKLLVDQKFFVSASEDPGENAPPCAMTLHCIRIFHSALVRCSASLGRKPLISILSLHRTSTIQQAPNQNDCTLQENVHAIELLRDAGLDALPKQHMYAHLTFAYSTTPQLEIVRKESCAEGTRKLREAVPSDPAAEVVFIDCGPKKQARARLSVSRLSTYYEACQGNVTWVRLLNEKLPKAWGLIVNQMLSFLSPGAPSICNPISLSNLQWHVAIQTPDMRSRCLRFIFIPQNQFFGVFLYPKML
jgi:hypothetical protein